MNYAELKEEFAKFVLLYKKVVSEGVAVVSKIDVSLQEDPSQDLGKQQQIIARAQSAMSQLVRLLNDFTRLFGRHQVLLERINWLIEDRTEELLLDEKIQKLRPKAVMDAKISKELSKEKSLRREILEYQKKLNTYRQILLDSKYEISKALHALALQSGIVRGQCSIGEHRTTTIDESEGFVDF